MNLAATSTSNTVPVPEYEKYLHKYILFLNAVPALGFKMIHNILRPSGKIERDLCTG